MGWVVRLPLVVMLVAGDAAETPDQATLERELVAAARAYDLPAARSVLAAARAMEDRARSSAMHTRAALLVAELERMRFEQLPEAERERRAELGKRVDAAAEEGLDALRSMAKVSERFRLQADLLGTMIRSDFRAKKYLDLMKAATARALELDPANARALVTQAKPLLFAGPSQGRDARAARRLLTRALELEPSLESAILLRALAWDLEGDAERALADCRAILESNPTCAPARERLGAAK